MLTTAGRGTWRRFLGAFGLDRAADIGWFTAYTWVAASAPSAIAQGLVLAAGIVPHLLILLAGGVIADRRGSGWVIRRTLPLRVLVLVAVAGFLGWGGPHLLVLGAAAAALAALDGLHEPALETYGVELRPRTEQASAVASEQTWWRIGQALGAAVAGFLLTRGAAMAVAGAAAAALAAALLIRTVSAPTDTDSPRGQGAEESVWKGVASGISYIRSWTLLRAVITIQMVTTVTSTAGAALLVPRIMRDHGWSGAWYGAASLCFGLSLAAGAWMVSRRAQQRPTARPVRAGFSSAAAGALPILLMPFVTHPAALVAVVGLYGLAISGVAPHLGGWRRTVTPQDRIGVVSAGARLATSGAEPIGPVLLGVAVQGVGLTTSAYLLVAVTLLPPVAYLVLRPTVRGA